MGADVHDLLHDFELQLFKTQLQFERTVRHMAEKRDVLLRKRPSVIFFDRGLMDMKAYMPADMWRAVLAQEGLTEEAVRARYDLVVHLVTAADGAPAFYTTENNATRTETPEMARENDRRVQTAWEGHAHWRRVDNSTSFKEKVQRATNLVLELVRASA